MDKKIIPAIIATNQDELTERILKVKDYVEIIQLDFMDGDFVPNKSIDFDFEVPKTNCMMEAHLMVSHPDLWIEKNHHKVDMILIHYESTKNIKDAINLVKEKNKKVGIVLNPETKIDRIKDLIPLLDQILIMTVNPGFYGSSFIPEMQDKIKKLREIAPNLDIEVDGGVNDKTIGIVNSAGANLFVSGSYIVKSDDVKSRVETLKKLAFQ